MKTYTVILIGIALILLFASAFFIGILCGRSARQEVIIIDEAGIQHNINCELLEFSKTKETCPDCGSTIEVRIKPHPKHAEGVVR